jgi:uncharacterized delta-60 repeat protein
VTTDFQHSSESASAFAVQSDGKLVAAGASDVNGNGSDFALVRYNSNGELDTSFGTDGTVTTDFGSPWEAATSLAGQADGKIVAAGFTVVSPFADFALARYNSDGTLDTGFGTGGQVITDFGEVSSQALSVAVQPDGKIVVAGYANIDGNEDFALVRYNSDGTLDRSFGTDGRVATDFGLLDQGFSYALGYSLAVQPDGKIVLAGQAYIGGGFDFALVRYNGDGTLDTSFGTGGRVTTDFGSFNDGAFSLAVQPDGRIVAAGQATVARGYGFALVRYNQDGTLDDGFGASGKVTTDFGLLEQGFSSAGASDIAVRLYGKLVVTGRAYINGDFRSALAQYDSSGGLDTDFGTAGKVTAVFGGDTDRVSSVAVQADGEFVVAGGVTVDWVGDIALARFK